MAPGYQPQIAEAISFYAPEARPIIEAAVAKAMEDGTDWDLELPYVRHGGQAIWVRAVGHAEFEGGRPVRLHGAFQDITQRVRHRQALDSIHERMSLATESGGIGVWECNMQTGVLTWDARMCALYGMPEGSEDTVDYALWTRYLHPTIAAGPNANLRNPGRAARTFIRSSAWSGPTARCITFAALAGSYALPTVKRCASPA